MGIAEAFVKSYSQGPLRRQFYAVILLLLTASGKKREAKRRDDIPPDAGLRWALLYERGEMYLAQVESLQCGLEAQGEQVIT